MLDGMKMASQGMLAMQAHQDILANNLANVNTAGYQASTAVTKTFDAALQEQMEGQGYQSVGGAGDGVPVIGVKTASKYQHGAMKATGNNMDMAIGGNGFFTLQGKDGKPIYSRNGNFSVDQQGFMVDGSGNKVLSFNGPIRIPQGKQVTVDDRGIISVEGQEMGRLRVTEFKDINDLYNVGGNAFKPKDSQNIGQLSGNPQIKQGFLEASNVNVVREMVKMMDIQRAYETNEKVMQSEDQMLQKSINEVGRVG